MPRWKGIVGASFTPEQFDNYCHKLQWLAWRPSLLVVHNTAIPTLADRPDGITLEHIKNLERYYQHKKGWSAGPHLFIDDRQIWVFTPLTVSGVHSPSWNKVSIGIEMLGDFSKEPFDSGRGLQVQNHTLAALATLSAVLGFDDQCIRLHREDSRTSHDDCPGKTVGKARLAQMVANLVADRHAGEHLA